MNNQPDVKAAEDAFFSSLVTASGQRLRDLLMDDFLLVDVLRGGMIPAKDLIGAVESGVLKFSTIDAVSATTTRIHGATAVVTGETRMNGKYEGRPWAAHCRYAHVYVQEGGRWRMLSAQGTPIPD